MNKNSIRGYAILGILFVILNIFAFAIPTLKTVTFWIAYTFTVIAFAAQIYIWKAAIGCKNTLKSKFLGFPVLHIGIIYLIVQLIIFALFLFFYRLPAWSALVICAVIAGIFAICTIAANTGRDEIEHVETKVQEKVFYIKSLQTDVELLANAETDSATKDELSKLAERIRFSDPMSHEQLSELEKQITVKVLELKAATAKTEIIAELKLLLDERNRKCKMLK